MEQWSVADLLEFARALRKAGHCFVARRVMQRVDADEITIPEATAILRDALGFPRARRPGTLQLMTARSYDCEEPKVIASCKKLLVSALKEKPAKVSWQNKLKKIGINPRSIYRVGLFDDHGSCSVLFDGTTARTRT